MLNKIEMEKPLTVFGKMLLLTSCQTSSPHTWYLTEKALIGQPEVCHEVRSRVTDVAFTAANSMLCGGLMGAEEYKYSRLRLKQSLSISKYSALSY